MASGTAEEEVRTLEDAQKWEKNYPGSVRIQREVRYFAYTNDARYELFHDWKIEELENKLWMMEQKKCRKRKKQ